ncbi:MAG: hypothetical protein RLZZ628_1833 [Bacteroidota bacterium]|jgi:hypothetical protein
MNKLQTISKKRFKNHNIMKHLVHFVFTSCLLNFLSCVSQKRYQELLVAKDAIQRDLDMLQNVSREKLVLADSIVHIHKIIDSLTGVVDEWKLRHDALLRHQAAQIEELKKVRGGQDDLVRGNVAEQERLHKQLAEKSADLDQKVKELKLLKLTLLEFKGTMEAFKTQTNLQTEQ